MDYVFIIICLITMLTILAVVYNVNIKKLKKIAISEENKLNEITNKYPSNLEICKYILNKLKNNNVKIEEDTNFESCLYIAMANKIVIADLKKSYTRIQTIAHECLHSIQDRRILLFNFIFSNLYLLYFGIMTILGLLNILPNKIIFLIIMLILSYMYYFVRSYLEMDAMTKAKFLAKDYMEEVKISTNEEIEKIIESYDKINYMGIKMTNYELMLGTIVKTIIMTLAFLF